MPRTATRVTISLTCERGALRRGTSYSLRLRHLACHCCAGAAHSTYPRGKTTPTERTAYDVREHLCSRRSTGGGRRTQRRLPFFTYCLDVLCHAVHSLSRPLRFDLDVWVATKRIYRALRRRAGRDRADVSPTDDATDANGGRADRSVPFPAHAPRSLPAACVSLDATPANLTFASLSRRKHPAAPFATKPASFRNHLAASAFWRVIMLNALAIADLTGVSCFTLRSPGSTIPASS